MAWSEVDRYILVRFSAACFLVAVTGALAALTPLAYKLIVDAYSAGADAQQTTGTPYAQASAAAALTPALLIIAYVLGQTLLKCLATVRELLHAQGEQRLNRRLSRHWFMHIISLPLAFHLDRKTGGVSETLTQGLRGYATLLRHVLYTFLPVGVEFLAITLVLVSFGHVRYLAVLALAAIAYACAFGRAASSIGTPSLAIASAHIEANAVLTDSLLNYETMKYFDAESIVGRRYDDALARTESAWIAYFRRITANGLLVAAIFAASLATSLIMAGHDVARGVMTAGDLVLINSYVLRLVQPLEEVGYAVREVAQSLSFLQRMLELLSERPEPGRSAGHPHAIARPRGELIFQQVTFSYRSRRPVLKDVSFSIPAGGCVAIVGASGSGKSSLVRLLFRLYEADSGFIALDGVPTQSMPLSALRQAIAVVPQDTVLFNDTIGGNIALGRRGCTRADIERAARLAHLDGFIENLPEGYDTLVGERGLKLSGGEKQRVAIARAALKEPQLFVFDEATSSLDSRTEQAILRNLAEVAKGRTALIIAHRLSAVVHANQIMVLERGSIVERGTHTQLLQRDGSYAALWRAQQGINRYRHGEL